MAWTDPPRTWVAAETVTSTLMNTHVRDQLSYLYAGRVYRLDTVTSSTGNVGVGEDTLWSHSLTAGECGTDGDSIKGLAWGITANNANTKDIQLRVDDGATDTSILDVSLTVSQAGEWMLGFVVTRTGSTTFRSAAQVVDGVANTQVTLSAQNTHIGSLTWANAVEVRVTGEATSDDDIEIEGGGLTLVTV